MIKVRLILAICLFSLLTACTTQGPMQSMYGPLDTPVFDPIVLDKVQDGATKVLFKEWTTMYENNEFQFWGTFVITDSGAYMITWDQHSYQYNLQYRIPVDQIASISTDKISRSMWVDSNILIITDKNGSEIGFALVGKNAAKSILNQLVSP